MIDSILIAIVTISVLAIGYHHFGYPALLRALARRAPAQTTAAVPGANGDLPSIQIIVPAFNEAAVMAQKIANLAALDYPPDKLSIIVALDGCTDDTSKIVSAALARLGKCRRFTVVEYVRNRGKIAILNDLIEKATDDIVALSDASAVVDAQSLRTAAAQFQNEAVGVVCGTYRLKAAGSEGERAYWDYQIQVKAAEAAVAAPMGAHGAFYLFRRRLWSRLPADTINDDFILPMRIVAAGFGAVYDQSIIATELETTRSDQEFRRRVRIGAGNMQQLLRLPQLLNPRQGKLAFVFASGKALRPMIPFLVLLAGLASSLLAIKGYSLFGWLLAVGGAATLTAVYAMKTRDPSLPKPVQWLGYFFEGHLASFLGAVQCLSGGKIGHWQPNDDSATDAQSWTYLSPAVTFSKRMFDIVLALGVLAVMVVLLPFIAFAIWRDSPGPLFYRQLRVGRSTPHATELFQLIKFRTMYIDAEARGAQWATKDDPRITPVGLFLRKTRLDELPQCINVLKGEMSIIGPRPERPSYFSKLETEIPFYTERTYGVKPGITGLAQVHLPYDGTIDDVRTKCVYDHAYAARIATWPNWLKTDLEIVGKTLAVMAGRKGQ